MKLQSVTFYGPEVLKPFIDVITAPEKWMPPESLTTADQQAICEWLESPLGRKIDLIMYNQAQQAMQAAVFAQTSEVVALAKFAAGYKAGWQAFKTLSVIPLTNQREDEADNQTGLDALDELNP